MQQVVKPTHLDLFSGIGGFALGFEWAGFDTIGFSEVEPYASAILKKHWPNVINYGDLRTIPDGHCDVLTGGFPCQPFSIAGRRLGTEDHRNLWPAMLDVIDRWRPTYILGENVVNIKNMVLSQCLDDMEKRGYQCKAFDISTCAAGLPTVERHIWIIAKSISIGLERRSTSVSQEFGIKGEVLGNGRKIHAATTKLGNRRHLPRPKLLRSRKGIPGYVDRIRCLGNSVSPQIVEIFARAIRQDMMTEDMMTDEQRNTVSMV